MPAGISFFFDTTQGNQLYLLPAELDLELVTGLEIEQGGVGITYQ